MRRKRHQTYLVTDGSGCPVESTLRLGLRFRRTYIYMRETDHGDAKNALKNRKQINFGHLKCAQKPSNDRNQASPPETTPSSHRNAVVPPRVFTSIPSIRMRYDLKITISKSRNHVQDLHHIVHSTSISYAAGYIRQSLEPHHVSTWTKASTG